MFVRLVKKPNDRVSIRVVESRREDGKVRQKIICGVGTAHKDDAARINSLRNVAEKVIINLKNENNPALPGLEESVHGNKQKSVRDEETKVSVSQLKEESRVQKGIDDIFGAKFEQLNLFDSINTGYKTKQSNEIFKQVVLERIANPTSKRRSVKNLSLDKGISVDLNKVYRMMDNVHKSSDRIKAKIARGLSRFTE